MSLYTALPINNYNASTTDFKERGITTLRPCRISEVHFVPIRTTPLKPVYVLSAAMLPSILRAYLDDKPVGDQTADAVTKAFPAEDIKRLPFDMPTLFVEGVGDGDKQLMEGLGMRPFESRKGVYVGQPEATRLKELAAFTSISPDDRWVPKGNVRQAGYNAVSLAWRCLIIVAALTDLWSTDDCSVYVASSNFWPRFQEGAAYPKETKKDKEGKEVQEDPRFPFHDDESSSSEPVLVPGAEGKEIQPIRGTDSLIAPEWTGAIEWMDRACLDATSTGSVEAYHGSRRHVFPFFHGLLYTDLNFVPGAFFDLFASIIHKDATQFASLLPILREGLKEAACSPAGHALSHALFGLQLALRGHTSFELVHDGKSYKGFMLGPDVDIMMGQSIRKPLTGDDLTRELKKMASHEAGLTLIYDVLDVLPLSSTGSTDAVKRDMTVSARALARVIRVRRVEDLSKDDELCRELKKKFEKGVGMLQYRQEFEQISESTVHTFINHIRNGTEDDLGPFLLDGSLTFCRDPIAFGLAIFGMECPSIWKGKKEIVIYRGAGGADPNLAVGADGRRPVPYIPIYKSSYAQAIVEWRSALSKSAIKVVGGKTPKQFSLPKADTIKIAGSQFESFYGDLWSLMEKWAKDEEKKSAKRKEADNAEGRKDKDGKLKRADRDTVVAYFDDL